MSVESLIEKPQSNYNLTLNYQNVRGLNSKTQLFYNNVSITSEEYDIIAITESWLIVYMIVNCFPMNFWSIERIDVLKSVLSLEEVECYWQ